MVNNPLLDKVLNLEKWQAVQDSIAEITNFAIVAVDYKGDTVTRHSRCCEFCQLIRENPALAQYCRKCDSRGGLEAVRSNQPYIYLCHFNIVDIAIPIIINNNYAGAILAGQVRTPDVENLENILIKPDSLSDLPNGEMTKLYNKLPLMRFDEIYKKTKMLNQICNYIIEESLQKNLLIEMYEKMYQVDTTAAYAAEPAYAHFESLMAHGEPVSNKFIKPQLPESVQNYTLKPAIEYIHTHISERLTIANLTKVCNVSAGYLSRLFVKVTGDTFTEYHNKLKVQIACSLLRETDLSVSRISDDLGFSDPSYFNRIFKKYEDVTPAVFRKFHK